MRHSRIIALMLGRLQMSVDEAIVCYGSLSTKVFSEVQRSGGGKFKASNLEAVIKDIVKKYAGNEDERMMDMRRNACKT